MLIKEHLVNYFKIKEINLFPIADIHINSDMFNEKRWKEWAYSFTHAKNPLCVIAGDIIDEDRPSTRKMRREMFDDRKEAYSAEDKQHLYYLDKNVIPKLKFLNSDNCLGCIDGDHYRQYSNGLTSTQYICSILKIPYLRDGQAIISIKALQKNNGNNKDKPYINRGSYNILVRHGKGYNSKAGGTLNGMLNFSSFYEGIDCYIKGHSHNAIIYPHQVRKFNNYSMDIILKEILEVNCGSFRDSFSNKYTDYAEIREYPESNKRQCYINIKINRGNNHNEIITRFGYF